ncbi:MAG TPA: exopolysaccharide biosynthesis protein [Mycobacteriales bacterium]|nr:exopolysaccharide biosynthesis protein [Mycobacteriales bacterium]
MTDPVTDEATEPLSDRLQAWLEADGEKSLGALVTTFGPQSFAILFLVLMAFPALPLPTGGVSHVLEIATMLLALEQVVGRRTVWLPQRLAKRELKALSGKFTQALVRRIRWFEKYSKPRFEHLLGWRATGSAIGLIVLALTVAAFVAPPFSGLDTLPALGVVVLSLGVLLGDAAIAAVGVVIGAAGVALVFALGSAVLHFL